MDQRVKAGRPDYEFRKIVKDVGTPILLRKQEHVFRQGDSNRNIYFVVSGLLKAYYVSSEGKESIKSFIQMGSTIGNLSAAYQGLPCTFNLMTLEDAKLVKFSFASLLQAANNSHDIAKEMIDMLLSLSMRKEQREYEFLSLPAEERYLNLCKREPELTQKLTQNDIARYLGITPVALSRIKKRLR